MKSLLYLLLGLSLALSISGSLIFGAVLLIWWGIESFRSKEKPSWTSSPLDIPIVVYGLWGVLTAFIMSSTSLRKSFSTQSAFLIFFLLAHGTNRENLTQLIRGLCIGVGISAVWGLLQYFSGINFIPTPRQWVVPEFYAGWPEGLVHELSLRDGRVIGSRSHPLTFAEGLIPVFFFSAWVLLRQYQTGFLNRKTWIAITVLLGLTVSGLVLAQGRAVWLGVGGGCVFLIPLIPKGRRLLVTSLALVGVGLVLAGSPQLRGRLMSVFSAKSGSVPDQVSKSTRFDLWEQSLGLAKENPITGVGVRGVKLQLRSSIINETRTWSEVHNQYLQVLAERGVIGFGLFLWILFLVLRVVWGLPPPYRWAYLGATFAFLVAGLTESWMKDKEVAMLFWTLIGSAELIRRER